MKTFLLDHLKDSELNFPHPISTLERRLIGTEIPVSSLDKGMESGGPHPIPLFHR